MSNAPTGDPQDRYCVYLLENEWGEPFYVGFTTNVALIGADWL
jgi:hypothetical protein